MFGAIRRWFHDRLQSEAVRTLAYPVIVSIAGYLVYRGVISQTQSDYYVTVIVLIAGPGLVEFARAKVWSQNSFNELLDKVLGHKKKPEVTHAATKDADLPGPGGPDANPA